MGENSARSMRAGAADPESAAASQAGLCQRTDVMAGAPAPQAPPNNAGCFAAAHGLQTISAKLLESSECL
jgi:hypothetical protein